MTNRIKRLSPKYLTFKSGHFDDRQLVTTPGSLRLYVVLCHSGFWFRLPPPDNWALVGHAPFITFTLQECQKPSELVRVGPVVLPDLDLWDPPKWRSGTNRYDSITQSVRFLCSKPSFLFVIVQCFFCSRCFIIFGSLFSFSFEYTLLRGSNQSPNTLVQC